MKNKPKAAPPTEFTRFEELTRKLVSVPKKEIEKQEKKSKAAKSESRKKRS